MVTARAYSKATVSMLGIPVVRGSILRLSIGISAVILMLSPPLERLEAQSLLYHMVIEHILYIISGILIALAVEGLVIGSLMSSKTSGNQSILSAFYQKLLRVNYQYNPGGIVGIGSAAGLVIFWHLPSNFDIATLDQFYHILMHLSLSIAGTLIFTSLRVISRVRSILVLIAAGKVIGITGFVLASSESQIYLTYVLSQHGEAGMAMIVMMMMIDVISVPYLMRILIRKDPPVVELQNGA